MAKKAPPRRPNTPGTKHHYYGQMAKQRTRNRIARKIAYASRRRNAA